MDLVEYLIAIVRAQRAVNHARTVTHDLSVMPHYMARIHTQFIDDETMVEKKKFADTSLTIDVLCARTIAVYRLTGQGFIPTTCLLFSLDSRAMKPQLFSMS